MIKSLVENLISSYINGESNVNSSGDRIYDGALIGISKGDDPLYEFMKKDIGEQYWTPVEAFCIAYPGLSFEAHELSIVSWILPFTGKTKLSQYSNEQFPSVNWVNGRLDGERFNDGLREHLVNALRSRDVMAVAPCIMDEWDNFKSDRYGYASKWSERHTAYISGLGTFGLCDGLITKVGKAHRCGSIIVLSDIQATERAYSHYHDYCTFYVNGTCKKCIERCPAGALSEEGHDKSICRKYQREIIQEHIKKEYDLESVCCGLCQTNVPCESEVPQHYLKK